MRNTRYSCQILVKLEFSRQIFYKSSNIKFHKNAARVNTVVLRGETDKRDDAFYTFAKALRNDTVRYYTFM